MRVLTNPDPIHAELPRYLRDTERHRIQASERLALIPRTCATCPTLLSRWNNQPTCGPCRVKDRDRITTGPKPETIRPRQCRTCLKVFTPKTNKRRRICPGCWDSL